MIFCCKPVSARMHKLAIGGGVAIGIATYSGSGATKIEGRIK